jgi:hypothetical protein
MVQVVASHHSDYMADALIAALFMDSIVAPELSRDGL